jgi:Zn-dependent metalloprotease
MKIMQLKSNSKHHYRALIKTILALSTVLLSSLVFSNSFVFPNTVSIERSTLAESFVDSNLVKSVGLREESSLAGFVKASILSPQRNLNGTVANALVLTKISADGKHARYSQRFNGYEVFGGEVIAHLDRKGINLDQVTGNFITGLEAASIAKKATLKQDQAIGKAKKIMDQSHQWDYQNEDANLVVYHNPDIEDFEPTLAYVVNFLAVSKSADPSRPFIVVDAKTGDILDRWEGLNT